MLLPRSDWLSLPQTVAFVVKATGEPRSAVRSALIDAALAGAIIATGCLHASTVPGEPEYFAARLNPRTVVRPEAWGDEICWQISRVGLYSLVRFERAEIERWLGTATQQQPADAGEAVPVATVSPDDSSTTDEAAIISPSTGIAEAKADQQVGGRERPASAVRRRRGPMPGKLRRFEAADRELFPVLEKLMKVDKSSAYAAALRLASGEISGEIVSGWGTPESRAKRLSGAYLKDKRLEKTKTETR
jgi:hypothetical protein